MEQFPYSALHLRVHGHDGSVIGRVTAVERNEYGEIVAVEIPGLEPPDAPESMIAEDAAFDDLRRIMRDQAATG